MLNKSIGILSIMLCAGLLLVFCKNATNAPKDSVETVARLKINNGDISGWTITNSNVYYSAGVWADNPVDGCDGKAYALSNPSAYSEVLDENMGGPNGASVLIYILNYTTPANATERYNISKTITSSSADPLTPTFADSIAVGDNSHDAITVYAHFKQFYILLAFAGYADYQFSKTDAITFLGLLEGKINGN
jgi:hypothetical protein